MRAGTQPMSISVGRVKCRAFTRGARLRLRGLLPRCLERRATVKPRRLVLLAERLRVFRRDRGDLMRKRARDLAIFFFFFLHHLHVLQSHVSFLVIVLFIYI